MAQASDRYAGEKIDVGIAVGVGQGRAFAVIECETGEQRDSLAPRRDIFLLEVEDLFRLGSRYCRFDRGKFSVAGCRGLQGVTVRILLLNFQRDSNAAGLADLSHGARSRERPGLAPGYSWASH